MGVIASAQAVELRHALVCRGCAGRRTRGSEEAGWERVPCLERQAGHALRVSITRRARVRVHATHKAVFAVHGALGQHQFDGSPSPRDTPALNIEFS